MVNVGPACAAAQVRGALHLRRGARAALRAGCNDGGAVPDSLYGVCNFQGQIPEGVYVDMLSLCPDYNQPLQILQKVQDIVALGDLYGVGNLSLNTIFLFAPQADVEARCQGRRAVCYVRAEAEPMMRSMAEEGLGTFRDVNISTEIDFLDLDYESLMAPYELIEFFAINVSSLLTATLACPTAWRRARRRLRVRPRPRAARR